MNSCIPTCIITGCCLADGDSVVHGDLHELGDVYIFNAVLSDTGEAARNYDCDATSDKILNVENAFAFERRGVIIVPKALATLNQKAKEYVNA